MLDTNYHANLFNQLDLLNWLCQLQTGLQCLGNLADSIFSTIYREGL